MTLNLPLLVNTGGGATAATPMRAALVPGVVDPVAGGAGTGWWTPAADATAPALGAALALADANTEKDPATSLTKVAVPAAWLRPLAMAAAFAPATPVAFAIAEMLIVPLLVNVAGPVAF